MTVPYESLGKFDDQNLYKLNRILLQLQSAINNSLGFIDRGDPSAVDWDLADFTVDTNWHDLDCSVTVPAGAKAILFQVRFAHSTVAGEFFYMRKNGNVNTSNVSAVSIFSAVAINIDIIVPCDSNRIVEYKLLPPGVGSYDFLDITIKGWFC